MKGWVKGSAKWSDKALLYIGFVLMNSIPCFFLSLPTFSDGLNTLAVSAYLMGYDWRDFLMADGYYYKYGMTLFYYPLFQLFDSPILLYRSMLLMNVMLAGIIPVIAYEIGSTYLKVKPTGGIFLMSAVTACLPSLTLNIKYTWAETALFVSPWIVMLLLLRVYAGEDAGGRRHGSILIACFSVFPYMAHQRGIVILIATFLTVLYIRFIWGRRRLRMAPYLTVTALLLAADRCVDTLSKLYVFHADANTVNSSFSLLDAGLWGRILSFQGLQTCIRLIYGWLFNVFTGSCGLVCLGLCACIYCFYKYVRDQERFAIHLISVFSLLCFIGAFALGGLFFFSDVYLFYAGELVRRCDKLIYGRYLESAALMPGFLGAYALSVKGFILTRRRVYQLFLAMASVCLFFIVDIADKINDVTTWINNTVTINLFCNLEGSGNGFCSISQMGQGIAAYGAAAILVFMLSLLMRKRRAAVCLGLMAVFISASAWSSYHVIYRMDRYEVENMGMVRDLTGRLGRIPKEYRVIYLDDEITRSSYQYMFRDYYIVTARDSNRTGIGDMFMVSHQGQTNDELNKGDYFKMVDIEAESPNYHVYIKGRGLRQWLDRNGVRTQPLTHEEERGGGDN